MTTRPEAPLSLIELFEMGNNARLSRATDAAERAASALDRLSETAERQADALVKLTELLAAVTGRGHFNQYPDNGIGAIKTVPVSYIRTGAGNRSFAAESAEDQDAE